MRTFITVCGEPVAKARPRMNRVTGNVYTPKRSAKYEATVRASALRAMKGKKIITGAVKIAVIAFFSIPSSWTKTKRQNAVSGVLRHTKKPDADNILKSVCDALNGVVYADDSQCYEKTIRKAYSLMPRVEIVIEEEQ